MIFKLRGFMGPSLMKSWFFFNTTTCMLGMATILKNTGALTKACNLCYVSMFLNFFFVNQVFINLKSHIAERDDMNMKYKGAWDIEIIE
jgi:hypothetical protein